MSLSDQQLTEIDKEYITRLLNRDIDALADLALTLVNELKVARERLNQNASNSSRPSGSLAPWDKSVLDNELSAELDKAIVDHENSDDLPSEPGTKDTLNDTSHENSSNSEDTCADSGNGSSNDNNKDKKVKRKAGRQLGSQGFGRTQKLPVTHTEHHHCDSCQACNEPLMTIEKAYTGFYSVNVEYGSTEAPGLRPTNTHHIYYSAVCPRCELKNRSEPWRAPEDSESWENVGLTEWRLIGPDLSAMINYLSMDMRMTRRRVQLFLLDILGLEVSIGSIQGCLLESARALEPLEEKLIEDVLNESLIYADETSHKEAGKLLWLWVFIGISTAVFMVGRRTKAIFADLVLSSESAFVGWLMSDGYLVYRGYRKRLRCWAHLERKAKGLTESLVTVSKVQGEQMLEILKCLMRAIYEAREGPDSGKKSIFGQHQNELRRLRELCDVMAESSHKKTRELGREFLNDWDAIFRILDHPMWPLTNNEAERALRHWVILRRITQGTRSAQGSRALGLFASVIETCRLRNCSPILYIRDVIALRRQGKDVPDLPAKIA